MPDGSYLLAVDGHDGAFVDWAFHQGSHAGTGAMGVGEGGAFSEVEDDVLALEECRGDFDRLAVVGGHPASLATAQRRARGNASQPG